jgi:hypothetical protein
MSDDMREEKATLADAVVRLREALEATADYLRRNETYHQDQITFIEQALQTVEGAEGASQ